MIVNNIDTLKEINTSVIHVHDTLQEHQKSLETLVEHEKQESQIALAHHDVLIGSIDGVKQSLEKQISTIETLATLEDANFKGMMHLFETNLDRLLVLDQSVVKNGITLLEISTSQKEQFSESLQQYTRLHQELSNLHEAMHGEIKAIEQLTTLEQNSHNASMQNQERTLDVLTAIAVTTDKTEKTLVTLVSLEEEFKVESIGASLDVKTSILNLQKSFQENRDVLTSILETQEKLHQTYSTLQSEAQEALLSIKGSIVEEQEVVKEVLHASELLYTQQQNSLETELQAFNSLQEELQKVEALSIEHAEHRKDFEEKYFKHTEDEHLKMIQALNEKVELTQANIEAIAQSLKSIETFVSKFDKTKIEHGPTLADDIKGFFTTLFTKH